jgi:hypothetical protein
VVVEGGLEVEEEESELKVEGDSEDEGNEESDEDADEVSVTLSLLEGEEVSEVEDSVLSIGSDIETPTEIEIGRVTVEVGSIVVTEPAPSSLSELEEASCRNRSLCF